MSKLKVLSGREVCKILQKYGFKEVRITITVLVPDHKEIKKGTLISIIRQSGVPREEFEID
ncbi:MAG: type II toxin-antitoxin system HicA family toxin [Thermodesulfobacterium sp.]|nr:type II toxin-antitoxin system HicA family toxin [Thermodesulfobacterium sp.]